jgi:hypothetical protein
MPRRSNPLTYIALAWLAVLVLAANAGVATPDGLAPVIVGLTFASLAYLYIRMCRRWPIAGWLMLGFFVGLFGGSSSSTATTIYEYDDSDCVDRDDTGCC